MMSETKLDEAFAEGQFLMDGFTPSWRMDRNTNGCGLALYISANIKSRQIFEV